MEQKLADLILEPKARAQDNGIGTAQIDVDVFHDEYDRSIRLLFKVDGRYEPCVDIIASEGHIYLDLYRESNQNLPIRIELATYCFQWNVPVPFKITSAPVASDQQISMPGTSEGDAGKPGSAANGLRKIINARIAHQLRMALFDPLGGMMQGWLRGEFEPYPTYKMRGDCWVSHFLRDVTGEIAELVFDPETNRAQIMIGPGEDDWETAYLNITGPVGELLKKDWLRTKEINATEMIAMIQTHTGCQIDED